MISSRLPLLVFAVLALIGTASSAQVPREIIPLVQWEFSEDKTPPPCAPPAQAEWMPVTVPHIFRQSGLKDNTAGWYRLKFEVTTVDQNRQFYLKLEGAASVQEAWINGQPV